MNVNRFPHHEQDYAFGQLMLTLRTAIGLTQVALAEFLGVSRRTVGDWEVGNTYPKPEHLKQFIGLTVQHKAFPLDHEEEEIRALWRAARQKVLLDEAWLSSLLAPRPVEETQSFVNAPLPLATDPAGSSAALTTGTEPAGPEGTKEEPRARGERKATTNLPFQPTPFFGRDAEVAEITRILADPACHLLTLIGPGGVGKTRLAIEVAATLSEMNSRNEEGADAFRDGLVFVPLASVGTPNQIVSAI